MAVRGAGFRAQWGRGLRAGIGAVALMMLAACASKPPTAYEVMQQEKEQQALQNGREDAEARAQLPDQKDLAVSAIRTMQQQGRYFAALAYISSYRQHFGESVDIDVLQANALRQTGQAAPAEAAYRKLIGEDRAAQGWHGLGLLAGGAGNYALAVQDLEKASTLSPTNASYLSDLGYARLSQGDLADARIPLGQAAELAPDDQTVLGNLALLLMLDGQGDRAQTVMQQAGLSDQARTQVQSLADQLRPAVLDWQLHQQASAQAQQASQASAQVSSATASGAGTVASTNAGNNDSSAVVPAPMLETVMDRFGHESASR